MKQYYIICVAISLFSTFNIYAQQTYVPDDNFEQKLIGLGLDSGPLDDYVLTANISSVDELSLSNLNITDLTGINDFTSLIYLYAYNNQIEDLTLNINTLNSLGVSGNGMLNLDLSGCPNLRNLSCSNNLLESIDLSQNRLSELYLNNNLLEHIDLSDNIYLNYLYVKDNTNLESLDLRGHNNYDNLWGLESNGSVNLKCIYVDDSNHSAFSSWDIESTTSFVENEAGCNALSIDEVAMKSTIKLYPNPAKEMFQISSELNETEVQIIDLSGKLLRSMSFQESYHLTGVPKGLYFVQIKTSQGVSVPKKLIVE